MVARLAVLEGMGWRAESARLVGICADRQNTLAVIRKCPASARNLYPDPLGFKRVAGRGRGVSQGLPPSQAPRPSPQPRKAVEIGPRSQRQLIDRAVVRSSSVGGYAIENLAVADRQGSNGIGSVAAAERMEHDLSPSATWRCRRLQAEHHALVRFATVWRGTAEIASCADHFRNGSLPAEACILEGLKQSLRPKAALGRGRSQREHRTTEVRSAVLSGAVEHPAATDRHTCIGIHCVAATRERVKDAFGPGAAWRCRRFNENTVPSLELPPWKVVP